MKRYNIDDQWPSEILPNENGEWIRYDDAQAKLQEKDAEIEALNSYNKRHRAEIARLQNELRDSLEARDNLLVDTCNQLRDENEQLQAQVAELEADLEYSDSHSKTVSKTLSGLTAKYNERGERMVLMREFMQSRAIEGKSVWIWFFQHYREAPTWFDAEGKAK